MDPTHPDFFRRADPFVGSRRGLRMLRWLLPLAAAVPLVFAVLQNRVISRPTTNPAVEEPETALSAPAVLALPPLEAESVSVVEEEMPKPGKRTLKPRSHVVAYGETLSGIAQRYRCGLAELAEANGLEPQGKLLAGTILLLPKAGAIAAREAAPTVIPKGPDVVLTPVPPDWRPPTEPMAVAEAAPAPPVPVLRPAPSPMVVAPTSVVIAPTSVVAETGRVAMPSPDEAVPGVVQPVSGRAVASASEVSIHYLVQAGDRLETIAAAHFTTVSALQRLNGPSAIAPGQVIRVPVDQCLAPEP